MFKDIHVVSRTALPLGTIWASDSSLFELAGIQDQLYADADGLLNYADTTDFHLSGDGVGADLVTVSSQEYQINRPVNYTPGANGRITLPNGAVFQSFRLSVSNNGTLRQVAFKSGTLSVFVSGLNDVPGYDPSLLRIRIPNLTRNGEEVTLRSNELIQLGPDYMFDLDANNSLTLYFEGEVPFTTQLTGFLQFYPDDIYLASGFFGRKLLNTTTRTINASELSEFTSDADYIRFTDPKFNLLVNNTYDAPMMAQIAELRVDGVAIPLKSGLDSDRVYIRPKSETTTVIDNASTVSGTGISDAITKDFSLVEIVINSVLNPTAFDVMDLNFEPLEYNRIEEGEMLDGYFILQLPFDAVMEGVSFLEELDVDLEDLNKEEIDYKEFVLNISGTNEMPLELEAMIVVNVPGTDQFVDLLDDPVFFPAAANDLKPWDAGFLPGVVNKDNLIVRKLNASQIDLLLNSTDMRVRIAASTRRAAQRVPARIYSPSELNIRVVAGVHLDYTINSSDK